MTRRITRLVLICEDTQHEVFARRFLKKHDWRTRSLHVVVAPPGHGSGEQFVREAFASELRTYRSRRNLVGQALIVIVDGDLCGGEDRLRQLDRACREAGIPTRGDDERVAVFVPTRSIETWLTYLDGHDVDENKAYAKLDRARMCQRHVEVLAKMCEVGELRSPVPPSLEAACNEYNSRLAVGGE